MEIFHDIHLFSPFSNLTEAKIFENFLKDKNSIFEVYMCMYVFNVYFMILMLKKKF